MRNDEDDGREGGREGRRADPQEQRRSLGLFAQDLGSCGIDRAHSSTALGEINAQTLNLLPVATVCNNGTLYVPSRDLECSC